MGAARGRRTSRRSEADEETQICNGCPTAPPGTWRRNGPHQALKERKPGQPFLDYRPINARQNEWLGAMKRMGCDFRAKAIVRRRQISSPVVGVVGLLLARRAEASICQTDGRDLRMSERNSKQDIIEGSAAASRPIRWDCAPTGLGVPV
jgi:hypothetical protein